MTSRAASSHLSPASCLAIVPLRAPGTGKTRLAPALTVEQRAGLAAAMLADVVAALAAADVGRIVVAAAGRGAEAAARELGCEVVSDPAGTDGLDEALGAATELLGPVTTLLVVPADLPRLTGDDVVRLVTTDAQVAIAPTACGGTGGLLRRPGDRMGTAYGPASAQRHHALAVAAGASVATCDLAGFRHDVDTIDDLQALRAVGALVGPSTRAVLATVPQWDARPI